MKHHPLKTAHGEIDHLVDVADRGESPRTPAIVAAGMAAVVFSLIGLYIVIAAVVSYFVTGGAWPFS
jgi:hypothetical protein